MTLYEALSLGVAVLALFIGAVAHYRISMNTKDSSKINRLNQFSTGGSSQQAGRDISN